MPRLPLRAMATITLLCAGACDALTGPSARLVRLEVAPATVRCNDWYGERDCLFTRELPHGSWHAQYEHIEGFMFEPGFRYVLRVEVREIEDPPADGSSRAYYLLTQVSKRPEPPA